MKKNSRTFLFVSIFILASLILTGCTPSTPTPDPDTFYPECNEQDLIKAINDANLTPSIPAEIELPNNCLYTLKEVDNTVLWQGLNIHSGLPAIISEITIRGNNSVIEIQPDSGEPFFGHFFLDVEKKLDLYNLTLKDGARFLGGAVVSNHGDLYAYNVKFLDNMAYPAGMDDVGKGGAIYSYFGKVRILANSLFQQNLAGQTLTASYNLGGAIYTFNSSLLISNSHFLNNFAAGHGGAVYAVKTAAGLGGGLVTINNSEFNQNMALVDGGGLYLKGESDGAFITSNSFIENSSDGQGGGVFSEDSAVNLNSSEFNSNQAEHGGAVYTRRSAAGETSQLRSENDVFIANTAEGHAGAIFSANSDLEMEDGMISFNDAPSCGAIQVGGSPGSVVPGGELDTALMIDSSSKIFSSTIASNVASDGHGGGVCHMMGELDIRETIFNENYTASYGGGLFSKDQLYITDSEFIDNEAEHGGGGLAIGFPLYGNNYVSPTYLSHQVIIEQSSFSGNWSWNEGAGIWIHHGGTISINKSTIADNMASEEGGGIYMQEGNLYIYNSTLAQNDAYRGGGLYSVGDNSHLQLTHTTVAYNTARDVGYGSRSGGGGINTKSLIKMRQVLIVLNTNEDCSYGPIAVTGGSGGIFAFDESGVAGTKGVDSDGTCIILDTEDIPKIGSFNGTYVPIQGGSPLIDRIGASCFSSTDQIGTSRYQYSPCEPGSIEYDPTAPPPPPPLPPTPEPSDETADCDPFAGMEITVHQLSINPDTMVMPVYLRFPEVAPEIGPDGSLPYIGTLGGVVSHLVNQQGFPDRVYFFFEIGPAMPGTLQNLEIGKEDCGDPFFTEPRLTIPELSAVDQPADEQPGPGCNKDLAVDDCNKAGGKWVINVNPAYCACP